MTIIKRIPPPGTLSCPLESFVACPSAALMPLMIAVQSSRQSYACTFVGVGVCSGLCCHTLNRNSRPVEFALPCASVGALECLDLDDDADDEC